MNTFEENTSQEAINRMKKYVVDGTAADIVARYAALSELSRKADFGDLDRDIVVVDTETTGLSFVHDELIQIAAARLECGQIVDWYVTFVNPGKPIPEEVVHLTDIHDDDVKDAPTPDEALAGLVEFAGNAKVIAHNVEFDKTFTTKHPAGYPLLENKWIDSLDLSRIALPKLRSHRLIDLVHAFDTPVSTHRADADVEATCSVYRILLMAVCCMPFDLVQEIASMATEDEWSTQFAFDYFAKNENIRAQALSLPMPVQHDSNLDDAPEPSPEADAAEYKGVVAKRKRKLFSLRNMRRQRMASMETLEPKVDAELIASNPAMSIDYPSQELVEKAFSGDGLLGRIYDHCEPREEQRKMSVAIAKANATGRNLVVEAGTGVGKSMAYLVPSALLAKRNKITVGIATKTNSLLDQLVFQELPSLSHALLGDKELLGDAADTPLSFAALKGISHYPCLRKIEHIVDDGPSMKTVAGKEVSQAPALAGLLSFIEQSEYDDIDALKIDYRSLPRYAITTTAKECLKRKCPYFGNLCFARGARRRAENADIVVTNHSLLFCDLAADGGLLPPIRYWVVDEAHDAEQEARRAFTESVDCVALQRICGKLSGGSTRNVFAKAESRVAGVAGADTTLLFALTSKCKQAGASFEQTAVEFIAHTKDLLYYDTSKNKNYERIELWLNDQIRHSSLFSGFRSREGLMVESADKLIKASQDLVAYLEGIDEAAEIQREIASLVLELKEIRQAAETIFESEPKNFAYQASLNRKKDKMEDSFEALPLDIGTKLNETLYANTHSVVFASATVTVNQKFDVFANAMGLGQSEASAYDTLRLDSSFDFDNNMIIYVVKDMPEPSAPGYLPALEKLLVATHRAQHGSMLTLFTNRREMEKCFDAVQPALKQDDLRLVCQKWGVSVKGLRDDFVADETLSLFALKSFWQGFDAPGATLKGVVIPKLPFARPTDPLFCERAARDDGAWRHYVLPQAIIETKQAAGRLIRKADDTGVLILADKRLITKNYGKTVLNSMPSKTVRVCSIDEIADALRAMSSRK